jgi:hypothetical protein
VWTFHSAERSQPTRRSRIEAATSRLRNLEHREAELVQRLVLLGERHAVMPAEVTDRQVAELSAKLDDLRGQIDAVRAELSVSRDSG